MTLPLEKATYRAVATSTPIKFGWSKNNNGQIAIEFETVDVDGETGTETPTGETITWIGTFSDKTTDRTIEALIHAGWQGEDPSELHGKPGSSELPTSVDLVCEPEEWDGKWQLKVQWVNKPGRGRFSFKNEMSEADLRSFGAQLRANVKAVRAAGGAPRKAAAGGGSQRAGGSGGGYGRANAPNDRRDVPPPADDDLPFATSDMDHDPSPIARVLRGMV